MSATALPTRLAEILDDFALAEGREKLELLLQYASAMPALPPGVSKEAGNMTQIHECMTPVFVRAEQNAGRLQFYFDIPRESPTVRGFASVLANGLAGCTAAEVQAVPKDFFMQMGLQQVLTAQRLNGIQAILAHVQAASRQAA
jgi:cysteine desulfuration protein SufE